jgi:hypothetical protein
MFAAGPEKNRYRESDEVAKSDTLTPACSSVRRRPDMRFGSRDLALRRTEEDADRNRHEAADTDKPGPGDLRPPIRHEPAELPVRVLELAP